MMLLRYIHAIAFAFILAVTTAGTAAAACTLTTAVSSDLGTYSPNATKAGVIPAKLARAGLACPSSLLVVLSGNYLRAKFHSQNNLVLNRTGGGGSLGYKASVDLNGTYAFAQDATIDYMQNNLLNLLGLLGGSSADLPIYIKPNAGALPPAGTYTDKITINWSWYQCPFGVSVLGACLGTPDQGSGQTEITVTLQVTPQNVTTSMTWTTTWDANRGATSPLPIPGSRSRATLTVSNPDVIPLDINTISIVLPTPSGVAVALDGDGATAAPWAQLAEGGVPSTLTFSYLGPTSAVDDVDFSIDGGTTWTYTPANTSLAASAPITHIRIKPKGAMAKQSSFSVSMAYRVK